MTLLLDGVEVSRHRSEVEAMESASESGPGVYTLARPDATITVSSDATYDPDPDPDPDPGPKPDLGPEPVEPPASEPSGLEVEYVGAFRIKKGTHGVSRAGYAVGPFAITEDGVWIAGHAHHFAVGKYTVPGFARGEYADLPLATNTVPYKRVSPLEKMVVTGLQEIDGELFTNMALYYDAARAGSLDMVVNDVGYNVQGGAKAAGWMQPIPEKWQAALGGPYLMGYANNIPINGRLSLGPSLYVWDGKALEPVQTVAKMVYPLGNILDEKGTTAEPASPLWNELSSAAVGFIHGDDYIVIGKTEGLRSGIGYKVRGKGGYASREPDDGYNYFWRYRIQDILDAENPWDPRPYAYGEFAHIGKQMSGANYYDGHIYVMSLDDNTQSQYEKQPVIYKYRIK